MRLGDVATVKDSVAVLNQGSWLDGTPAIVLSVQRQPGTNTVAVVDAIKAKIPELQAGIPAGMHINVVNDASVSIRAAVHDVETTMMITVALVVLVRRLFGASPSNG